MNDSNLIINGIQLMLIGMSTVFVFLSILVLCTSLMQKLFAKDVTQHDSIKESAQISDEEIVAISSAVHSFRQNILKNKDKK